MMRSLSVLGATGSIGASTLDLVRRQPEAWRVVALTANGNAKALAELAREFKAEVAVVADESQLPALREALAGSGIEATGGEAALVEAASRSADIVMAAIVGCAGLAPPWPPSSRAAPWRWPTRKRWFPQAR
jgi:1-deoxy-D-xylulose-5-phosphate reductoisomerase